MADPTDTRMGHQELMELLRIAGSGTTDEQRRRFAKQLTEDMRSSRRDQVHVEEPDHDLASYLEMVDEDEQGGEGMGMPDPDEDPEERAARIRKNWELMEQEGRELRPYVEMLQRSWKLTGGPPK